MPVADEIPSPSLKEATARVLGEGGGRQLPPSPSGAWSSAELL